MARAVRVLSGLVLAAVAAAVAVGPGAGAGARPVTGPAVSALGYQPCSTMGWQGGDDGGHHCANDR